MTHTLVVGAGAAGAALAARLSEDPAREVTLVEAGSGGPTPADLRDGHTLTAAVPGHPANWGFAAELAPGRAAIVPRGRVLGGSSAINGGYVVRARREDFSRWARLGGGVAWSPDRVMPRLAALERDLDFGGAHGHGDAGPFPVRRPRLDDPLGAAFLAAGLGLGFPPEADKNALDGMPGIGPVPSNIIDGVRVNTAVAYLLPAAGRPNLRIVGDTRVLRVRIAGGRVTGVETDRGDLAADEVVLCAGAVMTPHLLMHSGIGPAAHLREFGIPRVADLPVGVGTSDHAQVPVGWRARGPLPLSDTLFPAALNFDSSGRAGHFPEGDLEVLLAAAPLSRMLSGVRGDVADASPPLREAAASRVAATETARDEEWPLLVALQRPLGRGLVSLRSGDPLDPPRLQYHHLGLAADRSRMRVGVRTAARLLGTAEMRDVVAEMVDLSATTLADDEALDAWMLARLGTAIHLSGGAAMGAVADAAGRVRGVSGLRVGDTSLLPDVPSRGPFHTAVFLGEYVAHLMPEQRPTR